MKGLQNLHSTTPGEVGKAENAALTREYQMQQQLKTAAAKLTEEDLKQLQIQMDLVRAMDQRAIAAAKTLEIAEQELKALQDQNRIRTKMDAQSEARVQGRSEAGKLLWEKTGTGQFSDIEDEVILSARTRAEQEIRNRYGISGNDNILAYENEINEELTNQLKSTISNMGLDKIPKTIETVISTQIQTALNKVNLNEVGANVDRAQKQIALTGKLGAQGNALERLDVLKDTSDEGLQFATKQIQLRVNETKNAITELREALGQDISEDIEGELKEIEKALQDFSDDVDGAKNDAKELQRLLNEDLQSEGGIAQKVSNTAFDLGSIEGKWSLISKDAINYPSFDMSGQFEAAQREELLRIQYLAAEADAKTGKDNLDEHFKSTGGLTDWADTVSMATNVIAGLSSAIMSTQAVIDVFNDPDATGWDKIQAILSAVVSTLPLATSLVGTFGTTAAAAGGAATAGFAGLMTTLLPIIGIVAGIAGAAILLDNAIVTNKERTEQLTKAAENLETSTSAAKSEAEGLASALNSYDSVIDTLNNCTRGTDEWNTALTGVKNKISEILDQYPELMRYKDILQWDESTGTYVLNTDRVEEAQKAAETRAFNLDFGKSFIKAQSLEWQTQQNIQDYVFTAVNSQEPEEQQIYYTNLSDLTTDKYQNIELLKKDIIENNPSDFKNGIPDDLMSSIEEAAEAAANWAKGIEESQNIFKRFLNEFRYFV